MFVFPVDTDRRLSRRPIVTPILIAINVIVFLVLMWQVDAYKTIAPQLQGISPEVIQTAYPVTGWFFWPSAPSLTQFISHQFLHFGPVHLFSNMVFLLVFGNSVEDRLGRIGFLGLYLTGGVVAALVHGLLRDTPILGASGAVAAVTAAYLALFPLTWVRLTMWIRDFEVQALVVILYFICQDILLNWLNIYNTAYLAHVGGYLAGFGIAMGLLVTRLLPGEPCDLYHWLRHQYKRQTFRKLAKNQPVWEHEPAIDAETAKAKLAVKTDADSEPDVTKPNGASAETKHTTSEALAAPATPDSTGSADSKGKPELVAAREAEVAGAAESAAADSTEPLQRERQRIVDAAAAGNDGRAAVIYRQLLEAHPDVVMAQPLQLDIANRLMADQEHVAAARAYELFIEHHADYGHMADVRLILGLLNANYLKQSDRARELLTQALPDLGPEDGKLAQQTLDGL